MDHSKGVVGGEFSRGSVYEGGGRISGEHRPGRERELASYRGAGCIPR